VPEVETNDDGSSLKSGDGGRPRDSHPAGPPNRPLTFCHGHISNESCRRPDCVPTRQRMAPSAGLLFGKAAAPVHPLTAEMPFTRATPRPRFPVSLSATVLTTPLNQLTDAGLPAVSSVDGTKTLFSITTTCSAANQSLLSRNNHELATFRTRFGVADMGRGSGPERLRRSLPVEQVSGLLKKR